MFQRNCYLQGADTSVVKTHSNKIILQWSLRIEIAPKHGAN